jgi:uncharacterized protein YbjT (DUF2867 family)
MADLILVLGGTGYVGSRLVPRLLASGRSVRVLARDAESARRFPWHRRVDLIEGDVQDSAAVARAVRDVHTVAYLVHGMGGDDFRATDRAAAHLVGTAAADARVARAVYLSGIVPSVPEDELSEHIASRREVEQVLSGLLPTVTLRAAVVLGSGSTSFEVIRQLAERLPVHTVPDWLTSRVQPIAVTDVVEALSGAATGRGTARAYDVGGPEALPYPELFERYAAIAQIERTQVPLPLVSTEVVAALASRLTDVPTSVVSSLVESLEHDMVCADDDFRRTLLPPEHDLVTLDDAIRRALAPVADGRPDDDRDPLGPMTFDPSWADGGEDRGGVTQAMTQVTDAVGQAVRRVVDG